jgi:uncharacterized protein YjbI with pentapeptide repeats/very-short-patch-repair endonuclease
MDASEILERYAAGERNFSLVDFNLIRANLSGASLSGVILRRANLSRVILDQADLRRAILDQAYLRCANLRGANLSDANLRGANLDEANLRGANLRGANLNGAELYFTDLSGADLSGADLTEADLSGADLNGANLSGADLSRAELRRANLSGANLFETFLTDTILNDAKLDGTILAYQKASEELQQENQELREKLSLLETQFEHRVEREIQRKLIANQGIKAKNKSTWGGMRFRSEPEKKIAQALDEMGVLFFPLPSGRVMTEEGMVTREVDFLICSQGIWGILECDGVWHLLNSLEKGKLPLAANDHRRDNDFNRHGLWFIKRFTDEECKKNPRKVARQFLDMLHKFHEDQRYRINGNQTNETNHLFREDHEENEIPSLSYLFED